jgi:hypothetical protein
VSTNPTKNDRRIRSDAESDDDFTDQADDSEIISMSDGAAIVLDDTNTTVASPDLEQAAFRRIEG